MSGGRRREEAALRVLQACLLVMGLGRLLAYYSARLEGMGLGLAAVVMALGVLNTWLSTRVSQLVASDGESKRLVVESPWSQFNSECQRF
jgi:hypothetical protein